MDLGQTVIAALIALVAGNHVFNRTQWVTVAPAYWGLQLTNVLFALATPLLPVAAFERVPSIRLVIGMMFFLRIVHNWRVRANALQAAEHAVAVARDHAQQRGAVEPPANG